VAPAGQSRHTKQAQCSRAPPHHGRSPLKLAGRPAGCIACTAWQRGRAACGAGGWSRQGARAPRRRGRHLTLRAGRPSARSSATNSMTSSSQVPARASAAPRSRATAPARPRAGGRSPCGRGARFARQVPSTDAGCSRLGAAVSFEARTTARCKHVNCTNPASSPKERQRGCLNPQPLHPWLRARHAESDRARAAACSAPPAGLRPAPGPARRRPRPAAAAAARRGSPPAAARAPPACSRAPGAPRPAPPGPPGTAPAPARGARAGPQAPCAAQRFGLGRLGAAQLAGFRPGAGAT